MPDHWGLAAKLGMTLLWVKWHICKHSENQKGFSPCAEIPFVSRVLGSSLATMGPWRIAQSQAPHVAGKGWISFLGWSSWTLMILSSFCSLMHI